MDTIRFWIVFLLGIIGCRVSGWIFSQESEWFVLSTSIILAICLPSLFIIEFRLRIGKKDNSNYRVLVAAVKEDPCL